MIRREAKFQTLFRHWARKNLAYSGAFELKQTTTNSIPFNCVQEHQILALRAADGNRGILYKISDESQGMKPFDMFFLRNAKSYVVIRFPAFFCMIRIHDFLEAKESTIKKSLTAERARKIADAIVEL